MKELLYFFSYLFLKVYIASQFPIHSYAIELVFGLLIFVFFTFSLIFQIIPFIIFKIILKKFKIINPLYIYSFYIYFLTAGIIISKEFQNELYFIIPISFFFDFLFIIVYTIITLKTYLLVRYYILHLATLSTVCLFSLYLYCYKYAERFFELTIEGERYSCDRIPNTKSYNLYDNLEGKILLAFEADSCIRYFPSIDIGILNKNGRQGLKLVKSNTYIFEITAMNIGDFSDGVFKIETSICTYFSQIQKTLCKTGYLLPDGRWQIEPKFYSSSDFKNDIAKVGVIQNNELVFYCINKKEEFLKSIDFLDECNQI
ncbi:hypothetical protein EHQ68_11170 [Leptospira congkakensis]|uniref:Uncharacterized protein n=1 Tax=Leptospira congkakensis TaxID=2484932 RepID=A0A4Z1AEA9_9LEPT|nr:hypothetical protein [Leptospira congkakensis]TGL86968.1 hypothetical protein EHQ69_17880 [Leptospira congkakensis]TGL87991.1 hypothetical protein EHQ68_11170 [Leptospira congkakensis]TGL99863.1 hypothetical protein EHQ70_00960 [Leptospira congkakensis]